MGRFPAGKNYPELRRDSPIGACYADKMVDLSAALRSYAVRCAIEFGAQGARRRS